MRLETIQKLLKDNNILKQEADNCQYDENYRTVSFDSNRAADIFVAICGERFDGHDFVKQARENGAKLVVCQKSVKIDIPTVLCTDSRAALSLIANEIYGNPTKKFTLIGTTGTNGKTTTSYLLYQYLFLKTKKAGFIGTGEYIVGDRVFSTNMTTPDSITLNKIFTKMVQKRIKYVVMEVSSHAISQKRILGLDFDIGILTNITFDHLDYHQNFKTYLGVKKQFIDNVLKVGGKSVINIDDRSIAQIHKNNKSGMLFSISEEQGDFKIEKVKTSLNRSSFYLVLPDLSKRRIETNFGGLFNIHNLCYGLCSLKLLGLEFEQRFLSKLTLPKGRLQFVANSRDINIVVDYAHTADGIKKALKYCKKHKKNRIITVIGAGGSRDTSKRALFGEICTKYSDFTIFTKDNSRDENPKEILRQITQNLTWEDKFTIIRNRFSAISFALSLAKKGDIVLVAGKGNEQYIIEQNTKIPYSDEAAINEILAGEFPFKKVFDPLYLETIFKTPFFADNTEIETLEHISTDSRTIKPKSLFFALGGENFDGNDYVEKVLNDSTCICVVSQECKIASNRVLKVPCVLDAYQKLAGGYRNFFDILTIGITGSVGKTTTKEFCAHLLSSKYSTLKTLDNQNNQIGVPKTLFRLNNKHQCAIVEMGTSASGEIKKLAKIVKPQIAILTNIHYAHTEFLGSLQEIYQEKREIFNYAQTKIFSKDYPFFKNMQGTSVGEKQDNKLVYTIGDKSKNGIEFCLEHTNYKTAEILPFRIPSIAYAIAVAKAAGVEDDKIEKALKKRLKISGRMEIKELSKKTLLVDCYNANPISMIGAIEFWKSFKTDKAHFAILGEMLELGGKSVKLHKQISPLLKGYTTYSVGCFAKFYNATKHFDTVDAFLERAIKLPAGSVILLKGSNAVGLEKIYKKYGGK